MDAPSTLHSRGAQALLSTQVDRTPSPRGTQEFRPSVVFAVATHKAATGGRAGGRSLRSLRVVHRDDRSRFFVARPPVAALLAVTRRVSEGIRKSFPRLRFGLLWTSPLNGIGLSRGGLSLDSSAWAIRLGGVPFGRVVRRMPQLERLRIRVALPPLSESTGE